MMLDPEDFDSDITPTTIAEIAPRVVAQANNPFDLAARIRTKYLSRVCALLIGSGVNRYSHTEFLMLKLQRLWLFYPRFFITNNATWANLIALKTFFINDGGEICFPTRAPQGNTHA